MTNPFDAAIAILLDEAIMDEYLGTKKSHLRKAIRVLEAAGRVDNRAIKRLAGWADFCERLAQKNGIIWLDDDDAAYDQIHALLAALPEKEE
jgi:hypothetical protein